ncbi:type II toxin-antitoxin system HipA family toxin [uncultured Kiloniella sp.]|uniref:type II toxin-antitoxin system HipA family toxin n=1 Tax=uncultured Kiloniella sp. TaxID=1133091 RepID=UPI0026157A1C|nr:type II toxin-antitoxin system HipA family toxin [uncultured Kiloniella sp.]
MKQLSILLNGRNVGDIVMARSGAITFKYAPEWLSLSGTFPISLSLPLNERGYQGAPVIAYLENLLPDNQAIRERVASKVNASGLDAFSMLEKIGGDCVGALQFIPSGNGKIHGLNLEGEEVSEADIAHILRDLKADPLGIKGDDDFRISIAGAQEKTALLLVNNQWLRPVGMTPTTHIFKTQLGRLPNGIDLQDSVENEFFCMKFCEFMGLDIAKVEICQFEDVKALVIERFDRRWISNEKLMRIPQEDFCQAMATPPSQKYQADGGPNIVQCMDLLKASNQPTKDQSAFIKAQILFWLLGATDGHAKNFSISLQPGGFNMTPFYDILSAQKALDEGQLQRKQMKLAMSVGDDNKYRMDEVAVRHFLQTAKRSEFGLPLVQQLLRDILNGIDTAIEETIQTLTEDFPEALSDSLIAGIQTRKRSLSLGIDHLD